jgi:osmotically-inducible protein OsmY
MAQLTSLNPARLPAKIASRSPWQSGRVALGGTKMAGRRPGAAWRGAGVLGRSARGGGKPWARGKAASVTGRGAKTGAKILKAARERRAGRVRVIATGAIAALGAYFLDPKSGKRRRTLASDKVGKYVRRGTRETERRARHVEGMAEGVAAKATPGSEREPAEARLNDPALARKVESELFRDADAPKGAVSVNVENGVVYLRGQVEDTQQIAKLVAEAQRVEGVRQVENLLHGPSDPAPAKSDGGPGSGAA